MNQYRLFYRRHLPHWQPRGAVLFVTFRLKGPPPVGAVESLPGKHLLETKDILDERSSFYRWNDRLDRNPQGPFWLAQPAVAPLVQEALHYRDKREYCLFGFCIMPNHVHAVLEPLENGDSRPFQLSRIMQSLKRHTARKANLILGRKGAFWQDESYDHVIRNEGEFERILSYVLENPVHAGLVSDWEDWPWKYCKSDQ